jgi:hypothetical protein
MPPTIPESDFEAMEGTNYETSNIKKYFYQIKFEVVMKEGTKTIPGKASLIKALATLKNVKRKTEKIDFFDTNGIQISPDLRGIEHDDIEGRFCMEIGGQNACNLLFGCSIMTTVAFSVLKGRTLDDFKQNNIFIKIHKGGFKYGVNWSPIGFFVKQHPGFIDNVVAKNSLMEKIANQWNNDKNFFDDDQKNKIVKIIEPEAHINSFDPQSIPFEIVQTSIYAKKSANETVRVNAVVVMIPYQFFRVGIAIMDHMAITTETISNYIPMGYKKEDPENFFNIVYDHSVWIGKTRHITITNVPSKHHFDTTTNQHGQTLQLLLETTPGVENVSYIRNRRCVHVATPATKVSNITETIKNKVTAAQLEFQPQIAKQFNPTGSLGTSKSGTSKYSAAMSKYHTERSPNGSVATSIGEDLSKMTGQTGFSWNTQRKIPKEIDFTDATEFPPIPHSSSETTTSRKYHKHDNIHDESITDTTVIQRAVDSAMKKVTEQHQKELAELQEKFNKQLEIIQQQHNITALEAKFDKLMAMMMADHQNPILRESPIRKKGKPNNLENCDIETPTRSNRQLKETTADIDMHEASSDESTESHIKNSTETLLPYATVAKTTSNDYATDSESDDNGWITKNKKEKKVPKMTQRKIMDMMTTGGYGPRKSLFQTDQPHNPRQPGHSTPPRAGRGTPIRQHSPGTHGNSTSRLEKLSSTRSGNRSPRERED